MLSTCKKPKTDRSIVLILSPPQREILITTITVPLMQKIESEHLKIHIQSDKQIIDYICNKI